MPLGTKIERVKILETSLAAGSGSAGAVLDDDLTIACGDGAIRLETLQKSGGKPVNSEAFLRGARLVPGVILI
jgi:methionyl-tRNA formyltransferase